MIKKTTFLLFGILLLFLACNRSIKNIASSSPKADATTGATKKSSLHYDKEKHLKNLKQITFGGDNAEAYWSFDDKSLVFQVSNEAWGTTCDQIFMIDREHPQTKNKIPQLISTGRGRTTCSYFLPGDSTILYASTHLTDKACPLVPEKRADGKYVWPIYSSFDIFVSDLKGNIRKQLTQTDGYDAEATVSPKGDKIVFTSMRTGDLELFTMNLDGSDIKQVTFDLGYDGGAFFSPDGKKLIFRASRPQTDDEVRVYKELLNEGLVMPIHMELYICNVDGTGLKRITDLGGANWSPFFHPSGQKILFSSNHASEKGFPFNLFMINLDGSGLEQITYDGIFDAFPVFSNNGKWIVFSSNRNNGGTSETNLFLGEWID
ncbi:MAG: PD40 domain-containing protein [Bacteroidales bacterium]|nr:PD40 domain-containing protein [Bacteroidales bacterium]